MKCHTCGGELQAATTDMPFKISDRTIVILKALPLLRCPSCGEFLIEDPVMERVEQILAGVDEAAELEIVSYAA